MFGNIFRRSFVLMVSPAFVLFGSGQSMAEMPISTQTYDIGPVPCEGLDLDGIAYVFTVAGVPSLDCIAGTFTGPGFTNNIDSPNIEGTSAGILHLTFDVPTTTFGFGVAQSTFASPQVQSVIIDLFRPGVGLIRDELFLDATSDPGFVGARFDYSGPAVKTVTIRHSGAFIRFALDNVTHFRPPGQVKK